MNSINLMDIERKKFSPWRQVVIDPNRISQERKQRAQKIALRRDLPPLVKSALYFHEITGCDGFEFTAESNIRFNDFVILPNKAILVPWFLSNTLGKSHNDPAVKLTQAMEDNAHFLYDGWIEIDQWDEENITKVIQSISESLSIFSAVFDVYFSWKPKYDDSKIAKPFHDFKIEDISSHHDLFHQINKITDSDKRALYRSLSWLSHAKQIDSPSARYLFYIIAIESLAKYIEEIAENNSTFICLRSSPHRTKKERRELCKNCVEDKMENFRENPCGAISNMYFDCVVGIKKMLKRHLEFVLPNDKPKIILFFEEKVDGKTLYDLRNDIAHGSLDLLTENQVVQLNSRLHEVEEISSRYFLNVFKKCLGIKFPTEIGNTVILRTPPKDCEYNLNFD